MNLLGYEILSNPVSIAEQIWPEDITPLVSIICIVYNHEWFIEKCLDGILMQETLFPVEVIIHDDASMDRTKELIEVYEKKFKKIFIPIYQSVNQRAKGVMSNFIYPKIRGEYITICEGDDAWINRSKLQRQIEIMDKNPCLSGSFHKAYRVGWKNKTTDIIGSYKDYDGVIPSEEIIQLSRGMIPTASVILRKDVFGKYIEFIDRFGEPPVGDIFQQIIAAHIGEIFFINEVWSIYNYQCPNSWSEKYNDTDSAFEKGYRIAKHLIKINDFFSDFKFRDALKGIASAILLTSILDPNNKLLKNIYTRSVEYLKTEIHPSNEIIIYGAGTIARFITYNSDINIKFFIDRNPLFNDINDIAIKNLSQITDRDVKDTIIIISVIGRGEAIKKELCLNFSLNSSNIICMDKVMLPYLEESFPEIFF